MPEGPEAEIWRAAAQAVVGRRVSAVQVDDRVAVPELVALLDGQRIERVRRCGKVLLVDTSGPTIGLHFGMTGRLVVDGLAEIERLEYASGADRPAWDRLVVWTGGAVPALRLNDPRRLGRVSVDPDLDHLGADAFSLTADELGKALAGRRLALKPALLDQTIVAGLGNLCADEVLWTSGLSPRRPAGQLAAQEVERLAHTIVERLPQLVAAGGSTHGVLSPAVRAAVPACMRCGGGLRRERIGGRTAVWCPVHQR